MHMNSLVLLHTIDLNDTITLAQHEYDHIEGITLANRMSQAGRIVHRRLLKKLEEQHTL